jgi:hypothetical protein
MERGVLVERPISPQLIVVGSILRQNSTQLRFTKNDYMVDTLAPDRSDQPFSEGVLPRRGWGDGLITDTARRPIRRNLHADVPVSAAGCIMDRPQHIRGMLDVFDRKLFV